MSDELSLLVYNLREEMKSLDKETRLAILADLSKDFCMLCGTEHLPCYCAPHYDE